MKRIVVIHMKNDGAGGAAALARGGDGWAGKVGSLAERWLGPAEAAEQLEVGGARGGWCV